MSVKPKTPLQMSTKNYGNSSFWMDRFDRDIDLDVDNELKQRNTDLYKLAARKRAVSNFVSILTSKQIPVQFASHGDSYTDGESVVISSKLAEPQDFDVAVGLALHEASHIKLSSFTFLRDLNTKVYNLEDFHQLDAKCDELGVKLTASIKDVLNWVEDRRIDNFVFNSSPGYRDYYTALYDKYFNDKLIETALKSDEHTDETFEAYMFRLINLQSKSTRLDALNGLRKISKIAGLNNIGRIKTTEQAFMVALDIFREILNNSIIPTKEGDENPTEGQGEPAEGKGELSDEEFEQMMKDAGLGDDTNEGENDSNGTNGKSDMGGDTESSDNGGSGMNVTNLPDNVGEMGNGTPSKDKAKSEVTLTDRQKEILKKKIEKQKDFLNGNIKKSKLSKGDAKSVKAIESSEAEMVEVGKDYDPKSHWHTQKSISCIFVKNMSKELMLDNSFPLCRHTYGYDTTAGRYAYDMMADSKEYVENGIRLGTILGKRLQTHSESRDTIFNRQVVGKLDRRMVASLGFGNEQVFFTKETDKYNKANLHISIDASGSMGGDKWENTMTNVVALAKAVDMIPTLEIQITFRTTNENGTPYIVAAYDSRKDKFSKVKQLFQYLSPNGTTPEGLCFEAISKYMVASSNNLDSYFLNISDGEPFFQHYGFYYTGSPAARHTKKMVDNMKKLGIKILSYYVDGRRVVDPNSESGKIFKECYGEAARYINVTSVGEVSKTMNKLFLTK